MSNAIEVMSQDHLSNESREYAISVINEKLPDKSIKSRKMSYGKDLSYIEGHTVIDLLNRAFHYCWSFEVVTELIYETKEYTDTRGKKHLAGWVAKVLGRLTIPGIGIKEQYGSKVLTGGVDAQESAFKSATTDAMKKCATLVGIGKELYMEDEVVESTPSVASNDDVQAIRAATRQQSPSPSKMILQNEYAIRIAELKQSLGITQNTNLNRFVTEASAGAATSYRHINNENAPAIIKLMEKELDDAVAKRS